MGSGSAAPPWWRTLHGQIGLALTGGVATGVALRVGFGDEAAAVVRWIAWPGDVVMRLLKMVIVPLIATSIITGVAGLGSGHGFRRLFGRTMLWFAVSSAIAAVLGTALVTWIAPGVGADIIDAQSATVTRPAQTSLGEALLNMIPTNPIGAAADGQVLGVILFSMFFGLGISLVSEPHRTRMSEWFDSAAVVMTQLTTLVIRVLPIGVFALIARVIATEGAGPFAAMAWYAATLGIGLTIHVLVVMPLLLRMRGVAPVAHFRHMGSALVTALSTSSSSATLPVTVTCLEENAGISKRVSAFVAPLGSTMNMDGTAMHQCVAGLFICQVLGVELGIGQLAILVLTAVLASVGAAGIPSAGLVLIFITIGAVGVTDPAADAIVFLLLAVDRPLDMLRTVTNIFGDSAVAAIVQREADVSC